MTDLRAIFLLFRRWAWLLALGAAIGAGLGAWYNSYRTPLYSASTRIMVLSNASNSGRIDANLPLLGEQQVAQTYAELFVADDVLDGLTDALGFAVDPEQIDVSEPDRSPIITVTVRDSASERAAHIANALVEAFTLYVQNLEAGRYLTSEQSLAAQIEQVEQRIATTEAQLAALTIDTQTTTIEELTREVSALEAQVVQAQNDLRLLENPIAPSDQTAYAVDLQTLYESQLTLSTLQVQFDGLLASAETDPSNSAEYKRLFSEIVAVRSQIAQLEASLSADNTTSIEQQNEAAFKRFELTSLQEKLTVYQDALLRVQLGGSSDLTAESERQIEQLQAGLALYQQIYANLLPGYESLRLTRLENTTEISQIDVAKAPDSPAPAPSYLLLGLIIGLLLAGSIAFLVEYLDNTLSSPADVEHALGLNPIGLILDDAAFVGANEIYVTQHPRQPIAEAYRVLRSNLEFASVDKPLKSLTITSALASEGKSTVAANLAATLAAGGRSVLLVDGDMRRPSLHRYFQFGNRYGLSDAFLEQDLSGLVHKTRINNLHLLTTGALPHNPSELMASKRMRQIVDELSAQYDIVLIDSAPMIVSDASYAASKTDGVLFVVDSTRTAQQVARQAIEQLHRADANIVGAVLNRMQRHSLSPSGYYDYPFDSYGVDEAGLDDEDKKRGQKFRRQKRVTGSGVKFGRISSFFSPRR